MCVLSPTARFWLWVSRACQNGSGAGGLWMLWGFSWNGWMVFRLKLSLDFMHFMENIAEGRIWCILMIWLILSVIMHENVLWFCCSTLEISTLNCESDFSNHNGTLHMCWWQKIAGNGILSSNPHFYSHESLSISPRSRHPARSPWYCDEIRRLSHDEHADSSYDLWSFHWTSSDSSSAASARPRRHFPTLFAWNYSSLSFATCFY